MQVHVLPAGDEGTPLANLRYRDSRSVRTRIKRAHDATARYLAGARPRGPKRTAGVKPLPVPPWIVRRLVLAPLMPVLMLVFLVLLPVVIVGQAICAAVAVVATRRRVRWRLPRVWAFAIVYLFGETVCLLACLGLWIGSGFGARLQTERQLRWHLGLLRSVPVGAGGGRRVRVPLPARRSRSR